MENAVKPEGDGVASHSQSHKPETRIIPSEVPPKFYAQHLKPYTLIADEAYGKKILEVGCGDGFGAAFLAKTAGEVIGIDYDRETILRAREKYVLPNLRFMPMGADKLEFEDNCFDLVCSFQVIEHIPEDKITRYLAEIKRVLKNDGTFYLSTLNLGHVMKSRSTYKKQPAHCREFRLDELRELLSKVFSKVEISGLQLTLKHRFYQRLKKAGIFKFLGIINPVDGFYKKCGVGDFKITPDNLTKAIDFICVCEK